MRILDHIHKAFWSSKQIFFRKVKAKTLRDCRAIKIGNYIFLQVKTYKKTSACLHKEFRRKKLSFLSRKEYHLWRSKFKQYLNAVSFPEHHTEIVSFFATVEVHCLKPQMPIPTDEQQPICIAMVKNDPERIKLFFKHYRKIGITRFAVIDNNSTDGTLEFLLQQPDADVYGMKEDFNGNRKNAFISRVMQIYGSNRWYLVVDTDELLSYSGMEEHNLIEVVRWAERQGFQSLRGYMVDMYSDKTEYNEYVTFDKIEQKFNLFDADSYQIWNIPIEGTVWGGPRQRMWDLQAILMKTPLFYFSKRTLYCACHYLFPIVLPQKSPYVFALRHYKFLGNQDQKNYTERVACGNFYNGSTYYQPYMELFASGKKVDFVYEGTRKWDSPESINQLAFIQNVDF